MNVREKERKVPDGTGDQLVPFVQQSQRLTFFKFAIDDRTQPRGRPLPIKDPGVNVPFGRVVQRMLRGWNSVLPPFEQISGICWAFQRSLQHPRRHAHALPANQIARWQVNPLVECSRCRTSRASRLDLVGEKRVRVQSVGRSGDGSFGRVAVQKRVAIRVEQREESERQSPCQKTRVELAWRKMT